MGFGEKKSTLKIITIVNKKEKVIKIVQLLFNSFPFIKIHERKSY